MPLTTNRLAALAAAMQQHAAQSESLRAAFRAIATGQAHGDLCSGPRAGERHAYLLDQIGELLEFIAPDAQTVHEQRCIAVARLGVLACAAAARYFEHPGLKPDIDDTIEAAIAFVRDWRPARPALAVPRSWMGEQPSDSPQMNDACPLCNKPMAWVESGDALDAAGEKLACVEADCSAGRTRGGEAVHDLGAERIKVLS